MSKWSSRQLATAAIIAALYTVMSLMSSVFGLTYGAIQCRFSEALTVLPFFLPEAVPGLFVGCLVTNLMSTVGPLDIILGSMWYEAGFGPGFGAAFAYNAVTVGIGEAIACYVLGMLLLAILPRVPALRGRLTVRG